MITNRKRTIIMKNLFCCGSGKPKVKRVKYSHDASSNLRARAVKDYHNVHDPNHISFREGEIITVTEQNLTSGLWKGFKCGNYSGVMTRSGYFPASAVVLIDPQLNEANAKRKPGNGSSELSRHYASQKHQNNGFKFADGVVVQGAPPSPVVKQKNGLTDSVGENGGITRNAQNQHVYGGQHGNLAVRLPVGSDTVIGKESPGGLSQGSSINSYQINCQACNGALTQQQQHRLSGQSCESGVSSSSSRQSYHSGNGVNGVTGGPPQSSSSNGSSSSQGSLDRLEESGYSSTINVHELIQQGHADVEVLQTWLSSLHLEEYLRLFVDAGYDMPTISRMMPEDLTAIGITKPYVRKRLKSEISRLTIHDGIPDYKPATVQEWLGLLHLTEYVDTLQKQGYKDINSITDITWEDLEDIGIKKLGHQKKMMLAIDRLRRINGSLRRLSGSGSRSVTSSSDVTDSPLLSGRHLVRPSTAPAAETPRSVAGAASMSSGIYSVSSGGIVHQPAGNDVGAVSHTRHVQFQQQPQQIIVGGPAGLHSSNHSPTEAAKASSSFRLEDGVTSVSTSQSVRGGSQLNSSVATAPSVASQSVVDPATLHRHGSVSAAVVSRPAHPALSSRMTVGRGGDSSDGDLTPTNERRSSPVTAAASLSSSSSSSSSSSVREVIPSSKQHNLISPRSTTQAVALPKPIPIVAKSSSGAVQSSTSTTTISTALKTPITTSSPATAVATSTCLEWSPSDVVHSSTPKIDPTQRQQGDTGRCGQLGSADSTSVDHHQQSGSCFSYETLSRKTSQRSRAIVTAPPGGCVSGEKPRHFNDVSSALDDLLKIGQLESEDLKHVPTRSQAAATKNISASFRPSTDPLSDSSDLPIVGGRKEPPVPPVRTASFKADFRAAVMCADGRFLTNRDVMVNGFSATATASDVKTKYESKKSQVDDADKFSTSSDDRIFFTVDDNSNGVSTSHSLLNEVIERLERGGSAHNTTTGSRRNTGCGSSSSRRLGDWQDSRSSSGSEDSDSGLESRRSESTSSIVEACLSSGASGSAIDTNTLPFANENVGTIKQRGQSSGSASSASSGSATKQVTVSTSPSSVTVSSESHLSMGSSNTGLVTDDWKNGNLLQSHGLLNVESETVFNDIDGMLMGLTAELDEMLKLQE